MAALGSRAGKDQEISGEDRSYSIGRCTRSCGGRVGRFVRWTALMAGLAVASYPLAIRRWHLRWGATGEEVLRTLPGDDLVPNPVYSSTRAITIDASIEKVWPWLVQIGQGRGGFYSYETLENLVGSDIQNAERIVPELQGLKIGDVIRLVPDPYVFAGRSTTGGPRFVVAGIEPGSALILRTPTEVPNFATTWVFYLHRIDDRTTRLIIRYRSWSDPAWMAPMIGVEPLHFIMEREMLRGIKARAERTRG